MNLEPIINFHTPSPEPEEREVEPDSHEEVSHLFRAALASAFTRIGLDPSSTDPDFVNDLEHTIDELEPQIMRSDGVIIPRMQLADMLKSPATALPFDASINEELLEDDGSTPTLFLKWLIMLATKPSIAALRFAGACQLFELVTAIANSVTPSDDQAFLPQLITIVYNQVMVLRIRDTDSSIRQLSIECLGRWIRLVPAIATDRAKLKSLVLSLGDPSHGVRGYAMRILASFTRLKSFAPHLGFLYEAAGPRFLEMIILEPHQYIRKEAVIALRSIYGQGYGDGSQYLQNFVNILLSHDPDFSISFKDQLGKLINKIVELKAKDVSHQYDLENIPEPWIHLILLTDVLAPFADDMRHVLEFLQPASYSWQVLTKLLLNNFQTYRLVNITVMLDFLFVWARGSLADNKKHANAIWLECIHDLALRYESDPMVISKIMPLVSIVNYEAIDAESLHERLNSVHTRMADLCLQYRNDDLANAFLDMLEHGKITEQLINLLDRYFDQIAALEEGPSHFKQTMLTAISAFALPQRASPSYQSSLVLLRHKMMVFNKNNARMPFDQLHTHITQIVQDLVALQDHSFDLIKAAMVTIGKYGAIYSLHGMTPTTFNIPPILDQFDKLQDELAGDTPSPTASNRLINLAMLSMALVTFKVLPLELIENIRIMSTNIPGLASILDAAYEL